MAAEEDGEDKPLTVAGDQSGVGRVVVRGRTYEVEWGSEAPPEAGFVESFSLKSLRFPLQIRGWSPGDRIKLSFGSKKLKKVFSEARVPLGERSEIPVVVDGSGRVIWACGLARSVLALPSPDAEPFFLGIRDVCER
ncbi:tRNA lysidine(34) synthetase TilS [Gemmatimonadota bacterium]